jgi:hypothetical protein
MAVSDIHVQSASYRGEGTWHFVEALTPRGHRAIAKYDGELDFIGPGAKRKAESAYRKILQLIQSLDLELIK